MANSIFRASPLLLNGALVAEVAQSTEDRNLNVANQYGLQGVEGQSIGADEVSVDFDTVVPIQGMSVPMDLLMGVPVQIQILRNGVAMLATGVIGTASYTSDSKTGEVKGKFKFTGGAPNFA